ncbi:MAG: amidohydrolase family protein [Anaerolineaceae bacterium]|nr:amidohydrolase family protein [Anaerolineaceae bacterium]
MQIDTLLTNAHVLTMDPEFHQYRPGAIAINESRILAVGEQKALEKEFTSRECIDCNGKVVMPGLVNTHTHVPMSLMRGLADDLRLDVWLNGYIWPVEREYATPEFVRLGTKISCAEMIRSGVTCFADMYFYESEVAQATAEAGMRALCSQSILKFPTPDARDYEEALEKTREFIKKWKGHPLIVPSIAPHSVYTTTPDILKRCAEMAIEFDIPLHTHISETALEVENMRNDTGMPVVPYVKKQGLLEAKVLAAHCVHIDEGEMRTLVHANAGIAHNPSSNLKLASGIAPVWKMLELGANVGIGTDGPASNNDLDMFEEIRLAAFLAKGASGDPTTLPAQQAIEMATRMGAEAMHMGDITGSLETGKAADLILVDLTPLHNSPNFERDPNGTYAQLVYATHGSDVSDVMVNGQWLMREHKLTTLDESDLLAQAAVYAKQIDAFLLVRERSLLSKLVAISSTTEEESFEIQSKVPIEDFTPVLAALKKPSVKILRERHYHQFDTYFEFEDNSEGRIRYREDHFIEPDGSTSNVRSRLTLIGQARERSFPHEVILSRSRYLAPATQSLRFFREYFKPTGITEIEKDRLRFLIEYKDTEFFVNLDEVINPKLGKFLEIKSKTWSLSDADHKAHLTAELIAFLGVTTGNAVPEAYIEVARKA